VENSQFLTGFLTILVSATLVAILFERLRLPSILGFLLAGVIIGPHGFRLVSDVENIHQLAGFGVVLLMLTIGLEFSLDRLKGSKQIAIIGGTLQILLSIALAIGFSAWRHWTLNEGFFLGSIIALSSTAIVLKYLMDRGELDTQYGRVALSILIFQDLAVVPLMIFTTGLGGGTGSIIHALGWAFLKTALLITGVIMFSRLVLERLMHRVAARGNREIVFLTAVVICLGIAWVSGELGLSLGIGAFFAGLMFANTDFGDELLGEFVPFRYIFVSIFFVSIGLLFDLDFTIQHFGVVIATLGLVLVVNFVVMTVIIMFFGLPLRIAMAVGIILSQVGEFSFLLLEVARSSSAINPYLYQVILSTAFLTMVMTPFLFYLVPIVNRISERISLFGIPAAEWTKSVKATRGLKDHIILCGYGPSGQDLAQTFLEEKIPFILIEMNPAKVKEARKHEIKVIYGDAANKEVMKRAGIRHARAVVISFPSTIGIEQIIRVVQRLNSNVMLAVRTQYEQEMPKLYALGADIVVMEEWQASYELNRLVLEYFEVPREKIDRHLDRIHSRKELAIEEAILKKE